MSLISSCNNSPKSPSDSEQPNTLTSSVISTATSPIKGVDFNKAKNPDDNIEFPFEQLIKIDVGYAISFTRTPVGLKHCFEKVKSILYDNNKSFSAPDRDDVLLASYVEGIEDFEHLNLSLQIGDSEVVKGWDLSTGWSIGLVLDKGFCGIIFAPLTK